MNQVYTDLESRGESLRAIIDAYLVMYGNSVLTTQPITGPGYVEPPIHIANRANIYTDKILALIEEEKRKAALEARIDEMEQWFGEYEGREKWLNTRPISIRRIKDRQSELKSQLQQYNQLTKGE